MEQRDRIQILRLRLNGIRERTKERFVKCECGGIFGGIFSSCCDNPDCILYDAFEMGRCGICTAVRRECCC